MTDHHDHQEHPMTDTDDQDARFDEALADELDRACDRRSGLSWDQVSAAARIVRLAGRLVDVVGLEPIAQARGLEAVLTELVDDIAAQHDPDELELEPAAELLEVVHDRTAGEAPASVIARIPIQWGGGRPTRFLLDRSDADLVVSHLEAEGYTIEQWHDLTELREHPGYGRPLVAIEAPADGTTTELEDDRPLFAEVYVDRAGEHRWRVNHTSNAEPMAAGEGYTDRRDRDHALEVLFPGIDVVEGDAPPLAVASLDRGTIMADHVLSAAELAELRRRWLAHVGAAVTPPAPGPFLETDEVR